MGAYRFFGLIDDQDKPTDLLPMLVETESRPKIVGELLRGCYAEIMTHDLRTMTFDMLNELIEKYNVSGATKKKAITFFLQGAKYAGLPLSTFIQVRSTGPRRRRSQRNEEELNEEASTPKKEAGEEKVVELSSGGTLILTVAVDFLSLSEADRKFVFEVVDKLKSYIQVKPTTAKGAA